LTACSTLRATTGGPSWWTT